MRRNGAYAVSDCEGKAWWKYHFSLVCEYNKEMFFEKEHIGNLLSYHEEREVDD